MKGYTGECRSGRSSWPRGSVVGSRVRSWVRAADIGVAGLGDMGNISDVEAGVLAITGCSGGARADDRHLVAS